MKIWISILFGTFALWGLALLHIVAFEFDVRPFGIFQDERTYPILINALFAGFLCILGWRFPLKGKTKVLSLTAFTLAFATILLVVGLECVILGIFGSPSWDKVQAWALKSHPEMTWVQEPWRVPQSACGSYCQDVHTWIKIRVIAFE